MSLDFLLFRSSAVSHSVTPWTAACQASVLHHLPEFAQTHAHRVWIDSLSTSVSLPSFSSSMKLSKYQVRQRILDKMGSFCNFFPIPLKQCFWQCNLWTIYIRFPVRNSDSLALPGHNWSRILEIWVWERVKVAQSCLTLCNPWTLQSMEFSRPESWSGQPFPSPGDLPNPGIEPQSLALQADSLPAEPQGKHGSDIMHSKVLPI